MLLNEKGFATAIEHADKYKFSLDELQSAVGGYIEFIPVTRITLSNGNPIDMYINEEGKLNGMEFNPVASQFAWAVANLPKSDCIVGPVVFTTSDAEGNSVPLTRDEKTEVLEMLLAFSLFGEDLIAEE